MENITIASEGEGKYRIANSNNKEFRIIDWKNGTPGISLSLLKEIGLTQKQRLTILDDLNELFKSEVEDSKREIELPKTGKLISEFAKEVAKELKNTREIFYRIDQREVVEIGKILHHKSCKEVYTGFASVQPNRFITLIEKHFIPGQMYYINKYVPMQFKRKSMKRETANTVLQSEILQQALPQIERIFTIPLPIIEGNKLSFPKEGYDINFGSWLPYDAPKITEMSLEEAKELIETMLKEFCFEKPQDKTNAIAGLLTPYLRGLLPNFNTRTPVFFYLANMEGIGKDYLAGITSIIYEGNVLQEPPVSTNENARSSSNEELRKKLLSAMISGRKRLHFANNKGYINNAVFEAITTAETYSDRKLGSNQSLKFDNEMDFSLSGNTGITYTADFVRRCIFVNQFFAEESTIKRKFENPNLHEWVKENRGKLISSLYALVNNWNEKGRPKGSLPFASFPQWAEICGGIMEAAGYKSPCVIDKESMNIGGDRDTIEMKELFEMCFEEYSDEWITMQTIKDLILDEGNIFGYLKLDDRSGATKLGKKISKFVGRILSDIKLEVDDKKARGSRQKLRFTQTTAKQSDLKRFK